MGLIYPCFCTRSEIAAEIAASGAAPHGPDGPLYPGTCRMLSTEERARLLPDTPYALWLDMTTAVALAAPLHWHADRAGTVAARPEMFGDSVLARKREPSSYHQAVTVDAAAPRLTDVVRGVDQFTATHVHQ